MAKRRFTEAQQGLLDQLKRYGWIRCEMWQTRRRRCLARLQQMGVVRYSQMRHAWVTTTEYDRDEDALARAEAVYTGSER